jgi:hypothetical protein
MDTVPLGEHVEVKSFNVAAVAHFGLPVFVWTFLLGFRWRHAPHRDFALRCVGEGATDGGLRANRGKAELIVYKLKATSRAKNAMDFQEHKVPALARYHGRGVVHTHIIKGVVRERQLLCEAN